MVRGLTVTLFAAVLLIGSGTARANSRDDDRLLEKLAALEARVAALEAKNQEYKRELEQTRAQVRAEPTQSVRPEPAQSFHAANASMPVKATPIAKPSWTGAFWGASAGGAATRSRTSTSERTAFSTPTNVPPLNFFGDTTSAASGPSSNAGGFIDLFAGWDTQFSRLVVGAQLEATTADLKF